LISLNNVSWWWWALNNWGPVTKIENIKTNLTKILRPTHFSGSQDIKTDRLFFGLILWIFFFKSD
jgi:hypothetical protein